MITTLTGENGLMIQDELDQAVKSFVDQHGDMALERVDGEEADYTRLQESLISLPFLSPKKLVVLKNAVGNKQLIENFEHIFASIPETTDVILVAPKLDKRAKYYKLLKEETTFKECSELDARQLALWLVDQAKSNQATIKLSDAQYLVERVGTNQLILRHELQKLALYNPEITRETIDGLTERLPQSTVFELLDAAFAQNKQKVMAIYNEQRKLKVEPLAILGMIGWQLHILAVVAAAKDKNPAKIAKQAKVHPFVVSKSMRVVQKLPLSRLKQLIHQALELDIRLKSQSIDADDALKHYLLAI